MNERNSRSLLLLGIIAGAWVISALADTPTAVLDPRWAASLDPVVDREEGWHGPPEVSRVRCWC